MSEPSESVITLYDIRSIHEGLAWSPNVWRVRYALNIKGIPYKTVWLDYNLASEMKRIGVERTTHFIFKRPSVTVPAIVDPLTGVALSDSRKIVQYLDRQYPSTPKLFPEGTLALQAAFVDTAVARLLDAIHPLVVEENTELLRPMVREVFKKAREEWFGMPLKEVASEGENRERLVADLFGVLDCLDGCLKANGEEAVFVLGKGCRTPSFADVAIAGGLLWTRQIWGRENERWVQIEKAHGGRWARLLEACSQWEVVV
ncbi:hypothetical protein OF83DRAFT_319605 [Amylostereum chailletii]|nr:hypothetical protein OF83DRAFT_319605 [Amylostereum chailletii]